MSLQALIFDLDDTLMDTHGQLVMDAHHQACLAMQRAGLDFPLEELFAARLHFLKTQPREDVNTLMVEHFGHHDPRIIQAGHDTFLNPEIGDIDVFAGVPELLENLKQHYALFLVTAGFKTAQSKKIQVLGIGHHFKEILIIEPGSPGGKKAAFIEIKERYQYHFEQMLIIGDRISNEIKAGNQLGCPTFWVQHGECAHDLPANHEEEPTWQSQSVLDVQSILSHPYVLSPSSAAPISS